MLIVHDVYQDDNEFPLGAGYIASYLRENEVEVTVASQDIFHWSNEELCSRYMKGVEYDVIGMGFLGARFVETVLPLCKEINKHKGNAWLVLGGQGASPIPEYILEKTNCDAVVCGEAEVALLNVLDAKQSDSDKRIFHSEPVKKLDELPFPAWDLFPMEKYLSNMNYPELEKNERHIQIITSRGCTNKCTFCYRMENGIRFRKIPEVVGEMKYLNEHYGVTYFVIQDELFVANQKRLERFIDGLKESELYGNIRYNISVGIRADLATDDLATLLKDSGCTYVNIGFESVEQQCLNEYRKRTTVEDNYRTAELMNKHKIPMGINFIWGTMSDTKDTLRKSVDFIMKYNKYTELRTIRPITPYPGCELYYKAIEMGLLTGPQDFFDKFKNSDLLTVNFTNIPIKFFYQYLYEANRDLILDHYNHVKKDWVKYREILEGFQKLYFSQNFKFRGARHYEREEMN